MPLGNYSSVFSVLVLILIFLAIVKLLNSVIKAAIIIFVIVIMFRVGWVYNSRDLREKLWLDKIINQNYQERFYEKYDDFRKKDKESGVVDTEKIDEIIKEEIEGKINEKVDKFIDGKKMQGD